MENRYRELKKEGKSQLEICQILMREHGLTADQATQICWTVETGAPMPDFTQDRQAATRWNASFEKKHHTATEATEDE